MSLKSIYIGTRNVQRITGAHAINIPKTIIEALGLKPKDQMKIFLQIDGSIRIEKANTE